MERQAEKWMNLCLSVPDFRDWRQFWGPSDRFRGISLPVGLGGGINKTILTKKETPPKGCSQNIEAAETPGPTEGSGRHAPGGCRDSDWGKTDAKKKPGG